MSQIPHILCNLPKWGHLVFAKRAGKQWTIPHESVIVLYFTIVHNSVCETMNLHFFLTFPLLHPQYLFFSAYISPAFLPLHFPKFLFNMLTSPVHSNHLSQYTNLLHEEQEADGLAFIRKFDSGLIALIRSKAKGYECSLTSTCSTFGITTLI